MPQAKMSNKKSFEFRMSKKVAELTQVVHMLFTRNHEKEVEIEALKDAYEHEIELVLNDAKGRIATLDAKIHDLEAKQKGSDDDKILERAKMEEERKKKEDELQQNIAKLEKQLKYEKLECQNARDLLIQAQQDIERLREGQGDMLRKGKEVDTKNKEIEKLKGQVQDLEKKVKDSSTQNSDTISKLQKSLDLQHKELTKLQQNVIESENIKEELTLKNKNLESEIRSLKKELNKKNDRAQRNSASSRQDFANLASSTILVSIIQ